MVQYTDWPLGVYPAYNQIPLPPTPDARYYMSPEYRDMINRKFVRDFGEPLIRTIKAIGGTMEKSSDPQTKSAGELISNFGDGLDNWKTYADYGATYTTVGNLYGSMLAGTIAATGISIAALYTALSAPGV